MIVITDYIKAMEKTNGGDIYIHFTDKCLPVAYGQSAVRLNSYFPEFPIINTLCSDNGRHDVVTGFSLERVVERFMGHHQLVDDRCIHIMNVKTGAIRSE